jgi:hypothetical protein
MADKSFENVAKFPNLERTLKNENRIYGTIRTRLYLGNTSCNLVQNILPSCLLPKNVKIKICRTITLPVVLYGCKISSLTLREEYKLRGSESR